MPILWAGQEFIYDGERWSAMLPETEVKSAPKSTDSEMWASYGKAMGEFGDMMEILVGLMMVPEGGLVTSGASFAVKGVSNLVDDALKVGANLADDAAKTSNNILSNTSRQLQAKFKHAGDFGVSGNYSKANAGKFSSAINQHINSTGVQAISGTYRGQSVIHYLNSNTGLNVISSPSGQFISGWKLSPAQLQNVLQHGGL